MVKQAPVPVPVHITVEAGDEFVGVKTCKSDPKAGEELLDVVSKSLETGARPKPGVVFHFGATDIRERLKDGTKQEPVKPKREVRPGVKKLNSNKRLNQKKSMKSWLSRTPPGEQGKVSLLSQTRPMTSDQGNSQRSATLDSVPTIQRGGG